MVVVEAGLADRDGPRVAEQLAQLVDPPGLRCRRLVGIDPERRDDAGVRLGDRERGGTTRYPCRS